MAGGCFRNRTSMGFGAETQSWEVLQTWLAQHSGSSQSTSPSRECDLDHSVKIFFSFLLLTLIIVLAVATVQLQGNTAVRSIPSFVAAALPLALTAHAALAMPGAAIGATLNGAVLSVPPRDAQAGAVLALSVLVATGIAQTRVAVLAAPLRVAGTGISFTAAVLAAV